jgi:hypothetical protein
MMDNSDIDRNNDDSTLYKHLIRPDTQNHESHFWDSWFWVSGQVKFLVELNVYTGYW